MKSTYNVMDCIEERKDEMDENWVILRLGVDSFELNLLIVIKKLILHQIKSLLEILTDIKNF